MKHRNLLCVILVQFICILYLCKYDVERTDDEQCHSSFSPLEEYNCIKAASRSPETILCFEEPSTNDSLPELDASKERELLGPRRNIFFLETSCFGKGGQAKLDYRQACTVEAAARMNPNMTVYLLYVSPAPPSDQARQLIQALLGYNNFRVYRIKAPEYLHDTPIEHWYWSGILSRSEWPNIHLSDFLRFITLWKYGGIYLDLDMIPITCLDDLTNFVGRQWCYRMNSAAIGLSATGLGFEMASKILREMMKTYNGHSWDDSSCGVPFRVLQRVCNVTTSKEMNASRCGGFEVFLPETFFPLQGHHEEREMFLRSPNGTAEMMRKMKAARTIHVYNSISRSEKVSKGSLYEQLARTHCPTVYNRVPSVDEF